MGRVPSPTPLVVVPPGVYIFSFAPGVSSASLLLSLKAVLQLHRPLPGSPPFLGRRSCLRVEHALYLGPCGPQEKGLQGGKGRGRDAGIWIWIWWPVLRLTGRPGVAQWHPHNSAYRPAMPCEMHPRRGGMGEELVGYWEAFRGLHPVGTGARL